MPTKRLHTKHLSIYLNDHLAGPVAALGLIEHVASNYPDSHLGLTEHQVRGTALLEALEGLALGITGKQLLWRALAASTESVPALRGLDYTTLEKRAAAQRDSVEGKRLAAAREAFRTTVEQ